MGSGVVGEGFLAASAFFGEAVVVADADGGRRFADVGRGRLISALALVQSVSGGSLVPRSLCVHGQGPREGGEKLLV